MKGRFLNTIVKITGWLPQKIVFRTKIYYEDKSVQKRRIKGPAIIISNHTSVWDYACFLFVFPGRTLRYQMAEVLFKKKVLGVFLKGMGGIYVNRDANDFSFISESEDILRDGGVVGIFPESRLPRPEEERPLPFKSSAAFIALSSDVPVIPVYTKGDYFNKKRNRVIIGKPINAAELTDSNLSDKDNLQLVSDSMRQRIIELGELLDERIEK